MISIVSYTIYHSPNAYIGVELANRLFANRPIRIERRPIFVPHDRGVKVADLVGGGESPRKSSYHREDCARWAERHGIELRLPEPEVFEERAAKWRQSPLGREELPARAFYAAVGTGKEEKLDRALFHAAWVEGHDVNDEAVVGAAATAAGLNAQGLLKRALSDEMGKIARDALAAFDRDEIPGVPTWVLNGKRFWGKDRVDWLAQEIERTAQQR